MDGRFKKSVGRDRVQNQFRSVAADMIVDALTCKDDLKS